MFLKYTPPLFTRMSPCWPSVLEDCFPLVILLRSSLISVSHWKTSSEASLQVQSSGPQILAASSTVLFWMHISFPWFISTVASSVMRWWLIWEGSRVHIVLDTQRTLCGCLLKFWARLGKSEKDKGNQLKSWRVYSNFCWPYQFFDIYTLTPKYAFAYEIWISEENIFHIFQNYYIQ